MIVILSLVPDEERPNTVFDGKWEHIPTYPGTGTIAAIGYLLRRPRFIFWISVVMLSFVMEFFQQFVPGPGPALLDAIISSLGLNVGMLLGSVFPRIVIKVDLKR